MAGTSGRPRDPGRGCHAGETVLLNEFQAALVFIQSDIAALKKGDQRGPAWLQRDHLDNPGRPIKSFRPSSDGARAPYTDFSQGGGPRGGGC